MTSSFNAFGKSSKKFDNPSVPVWLGKPRAVPVGGTLGSGDLKADAKYAAGTPVKLDGKTLKICHIWQVVSLTAGSTDDTLIILPGDSGLVPAVNDIIQVVGSAFTSTGKAAKVKTAARNADGNWEITVATGSLDAASAGAAITLSASASAGTGKSIAVIPDGYLYNDIYLGDIDITAEGAGASGAVIKFHGEGILIKRTPAAPVAAQMAAAVPGVLQVNY